MKLYEILKVVKDNEIFYSSSEEMEYKVKDKLLYYRTIYDKEWNIIEINSVIFLIEREFEIKEKVPEGFVKNALGEYVKPGKIEVWVNVFWNTTELKEQIEVYANKKDAEYYSKIYREYRKFLYTKYLCQQYSLLYEKDSHLLTYLV